MSSAENHDKNRKKKRNRRPGAVPWVWLALYVAGLILTGETIILIRMHEEKGFDGHCFGHALLWLAALLTMFVAIRDLLHHRRKRKGINMDTIRQGNLHGIGIPHIAGTQSK